MTLDEAREAAPDVAHEERRPSTHAMSAKEVKEYYASHPDEALERILTATTYEVTEEGETARLQARTLDSIATAKWGWPGPRANRIARGVEAALGVMRYSPGRWSVTVGSPDGHRIDVFRSTLADALMAAADVADGINPDGE